MGLKGNYQYLCIKDGKNSWSVLIFKKKEQVLAVGKREFDLTFKTGRGTQEIKTVKTIKDFHVKFSSFSISAMKDHTLVFHQFVSKQLVFTVFYFMWQSLVVQSLLSDRQPDVSWHLHSGPLEAALKQLMTRASCA